MVRSSKVCRNNSLIGAWTNVCRQLCNDRRRSFRRSSMALTKCQEATTVVVRGPLLSLLETPLRIPIPFTSCLPDTTTTTYGLHQVQLRHSDVWMDFVNSLMPFHHFPCRSSCYHLSFYVLISFMFPLGGFFTHLMPYRCSVDPASYHMSLYVDFFWNVA